RAGGKLWRIDPRFKRVPEIPQKGAGVIMLKTLSVAVAVSLALQQTSAPVVPKTSATTPAGCLQEVRDYASKQQQEMIAATAPKAGAPTTLEASIQLSQTRAPLIAQINQAKAAMAAECAARLDTKTVGA